MSDHRKRISSIVLAVHHRNGGQLASLDFSLPLLHPSLLLDSLDLAEVLVAIEREFYVAPFDGPVPPKTWEDIVQLAAERANQRTE